MATPRASRGLSSAYRIEALISPLARTAQRDFCFWEVPLELAFEKLGGLVPGIVQDHRTGEVLMLGYLNAAALAQTQLTGEVHFFSRSRNRLWKKGETSGHVLRLREIRLDCDADALLLLVDPVGPGVCHEGYRSCFFRQLASDGSSTVIAERSFVPDEIYGNQGAQG
jgi:phosphoribosyl-AMP cyclohydrolase